MKFIKTYRSPNFNLRRKNYEIKYLILHYTAILIDEDALKYLCNKNNKVSSHYLIDKSGIIFNLVDEKFRAWHAGNSYWKGSEDLNSSSIGIEIDNSGHHIYNEDYNHLQIQSLCDLIKKLSKEYKIKQQDILGHSDIAPFRKIDPGEKFPWNQPNKKKLCYLPSIDRQTLLKESKKRTKNYEYERNSKVLLMLGSIGYDVRKVKKKDKKFKLLIQAYQRHYRQSDVLGKIDIETIKLISKHYKDILT